MKRWRRVAILGIVLIALTGLGVHLYSSWSGQNEVLAISAELDRTEPGWRFEEWIQRIGGIPDEENSLLVIHALHAKIPKAFVNDLSDPSFKPWDWINECAPNHLFHPDYGNAMCERLGKIPELDELVNKLARTRNGRHTYPIASNPLLILLPHYDVMHRVTVYLHYEFLDGPNGRTAEEMLVYHDALVNCSRVFREEPFLISQSFRNGRLFDASQCLQHHLGKYELPEEALQRLQQQWVEEEAYPALKVGFRGERALLDLFYRNLASGKITYTEIGQLPSMLNRQTSSKWLPMPALGFYLSASHYASHAFTLKFENRRLTVLEKPYAEQQKFLKESHREFESAPPLAKLHDLSKFVPIDHFFHQMARQRAVVTAIAAERYRVRHGKFPETLDTLIPNYLPKLYLDPYTDQPFAYRKTADGVVIHSKGPEGNYQGDFFDTVRKEGVETNWSNRMLEFRLWDPGHRRLPPLEKKNDAEP